MSAKTYNKSKAKQKAKPEAPEPKQAPPVTEEMTPDVTEEMAPEVDPATSPEEMAPELTIADVVAQSGDGFDDNLQDFDVLLKAVTDTGSADALNGADADLTVFAPTDAAFVQLAKDLGYEGEDEAGAYDAVVASLTEAGNGDPLPALQGILDYHISPGAKTVQEIKAAEAIDTLLEGQTLSPKGNRLGDGAPDVADPKFVKTLKDVEASNGIIQGIDRVLIPSAGDAETPDEMEPTGDPDVEDPDAMDPMDPTGDPDVEDPDAMDPMEPTGDPDMENPDAMDPMDPTGDPDVKDPDAMDPMEPTGDPDVEDPDAMDPMDPTGDPDVEDPTDPLGDPNAEDPMDQSDDLFGSLSGTEGNDVLISKAKNNFLNGLAGDDVIVGGEGNDYATGDLGDDFMVGNGGNDAMAGGEGNDILVGSAGNDFLSGGAGEDLVIGDGGSDRIYGGDDSDRIFVSADSTATIYGGAGDDLISLHGSAATVVLESAAGTDIIDGFEIGTTTLGLSDGLKFSDLTFTQAEGASAIMSGKQTIATVSDVSVKELNAESNFSVV